MAGLIYKNVPKGFRYPLSKKDIKSLLADFPDSFSTVSFDGISDDANQPSHYSRWWIGVMTAYKDEDRWQFSLKVTALRDEQVLPVRDKVVEILLNDIKGWVNKKLNLPSTAPEEPKQLFLSFSKDDNRIVSSSFEIRKDK